MYELVSRGQAICHLAQTICHTVEGRTKECLAFPEAELLWTFMYRVAVVPEEQGNYINGFAFLTPLKKENLLGVTLGGAFHFGVLAGTVKRVDA
jgi:hypothetical protein